MPITTSAKKALRQSRAHAERNLVFKKDMRDTIRMFEKAIESGKQAEASNLLSSAYKKLDKAAKKGVIKKNTAYRKKSRMYSALKRLSQAA